jgi:hypothetical protein
VAKYLPASQTAKETPLSSSDTSRYWPSPERSRSLSAAVTPSATYMAHTRSHIGTPILTGSPSGVPVMLMSPPRAWAMMSSPGSMASGPSCPQPDAEA